MLNATHLKLVTGGTDSERSDTYGITMGPEAEVSTEALVAEYNEIVAKITRWRRFPTSAQRKALPSMRRRAAEISKAVQARGKL
jgi:hypothetical protein